MSEYWILPNASAYIKMTKLFSFFNILKNIHEKHFSRLFSIYAIRIDILTFCWGLLLVFKCNKLYQWIFYTESCLFSLDKEYFIIFKYFSGIFLLVFLYNMGLFSFSVLLLSVFGAEIIHKLCILVIWLDTSSPDSDLVFVLCFSFLMELLTYKARGWHYLICIYKGHWDIGIENEFKVNKTIRVRESS